MADNSTQNSGDVTSREGDARLGSFAIILFVARQRAVDQFNRSFEGGKLQMSVLSFNEGYGRVLLPSSSYKGFACPTGDTILYRDYEHLVGFQDHSRVTSQLTRRILLSL
jgi:hypothetical protein